MKRQGLSKAIANTSPEQAARHLEKSGLNLERYRFETRAAARARAGGFASAAEPIALLETAIQLLEEASSLQD
jgi:hypothetical protein